REQLSDASKEIKAYTQGLKKVEAQLVAHQQGQGHLAIDDYLTDSMTYQLRPLLIQGFLKKKMESAQNYLYGHYGLLIPQLKPVDKEDQVFLDELERLMRQEKDANDAAEALRKEFAQQTEDLNFYKHVPEILFASLCSVQVSGHSKTSIKCVMRIFRYPQQCGCHFLAGAYFLAMKKQTIMATSTTEAEYVAACKLLWTSFVDSKSNCAEAFLTIGDEFHEVHWVFKSPWEEIKEVIEGLRVATSERPSEPQPTPSPPHPSEANVTDQAKEIKNFEGKIMKLRRSQTCSFKHHRAWMKVSLLKQSWKAEILKSKWMQKESVFQTGDERGECCDAEVSTEDVLSTAQKDKGKKKIEEEDEFETKSEGIPEAKKKFKQLVSDEEMARKLQEDWETGEERKRLADEEANKIAAFRRKRLPRRRKRKVEQFTVEESAKFLPDTIAAQKGDFLLQHRLEAFRNNTFSKDIN
ncbi:hypothetical protein Tco_0466285, partial [Tanacetum coccineum]